MGIEHETIIWVLDSDPSIRWQSVKDVQDIEETIYSQERQKLADRGCCAELLSLQDKDGLWDGSLYSGNEYIVKEAWKPRTTRTPRAG